MIFAGNWKMQMGFKQAVEFLSQFNKLIDKDSELKNFIFFPPANLSALFQQESFYWGGQNVYYKTEGAFTGEISAKVLKEMGASFCLLGHSERRYSFGETEVEIEKKFSVLQKQALIPILCIGESLADRFDKNKTLMKQLFWIKNYNKYENKIPFHPDRLPADFKDIPFVIAYEPLWSIGTGDIPSAQEVDETAQFLKDYLPSVKVFYGGSVNSKNIKNFSKSSFLDGFLVGGASLKAQSFYDLYKQYS
ncbi:MAG: triose-phosphate isomerase [Bdellovibrionaceae bacterium]|nr:triose-phosphate isomerase [Pseudobdellovibrionaceae bacterium]